MTTERINPYRLTIYPKHKINSRSSEAKNSLSLFESVMVETHFLLMAANSMLTRVTKMNFQLPQCISLLKHSTEV